MYGLQEAKPEQPRLEVTGLAEGSLEFLPGRLFGTALGFLMTFTDHDVTFGNENILQLNPLTLLLVPAGLMLAWGSSKAKGFNRGPWTGRAWPTRSSRPSSTTSPGDVEEYGGKSLAFFKAELKKAKAARKALGKARSAFALEREVA